jgi:hypothetical protein
MNERVGFCGFRCDLCPAYSKNRSKYPDKKKITQGWEKYFEIIVEPEDIECVGCKKEGKHPDSSCPVRPCALKKTKRYCVECDEYPKCKKIKSRMGFTEEAKWEFGGRIPQVDFRMFFEPYESKKHFKKLIKQSKKKTK